MERVWVSEEAWMTAGPVQTYVPKEGQALKVGDRVECCCRGYAGGYYGWVTEELPDAWGVWLNP